MSAQRDYVAEGFGPEDIPEPKDPIFMKASLESWSNPIDEDGAEELSYAPDRRFYKRFTLEEFKEYDRDLQNLVSKWSGEPYYHVWVLRTLDMLERKV